ncbi:hypothetical protein NM208_g4073 [Fusarium decemcellulare]|uniref:Uncharacterized protein n=1 Tax=Fusarium decemcellulare TaxID=57161 RepID=A0ACC1SMB4_9HYPO|nr:hypothetical protein NM208_g4073 [Fusarium decemcellulare]
MGPPSLHDFPAHNSSKRSRRLSDVNGESLSRVARPKLTNGSGSTPVTTPLHPNPIVGLDDTPIPLQFGQVNRMASPFDDQRTMSIPNTPASGTSHPWSTSEPLTKAANALRLGSYKSHIQPWARSEVEKIFESVSQHSAGDKLDWAKFWLLCPNYDNVMDVGERPRLPRMDCFTKMTHIGFVCDFPNLHGPTGCANFGCSKLWSDSIISFSPTWYSRTELRVESGGRLVPPNPDDRGRMRLACLDWNRRVSQSLQDDMDACIRSYNVSLAVWLAKKVIAASEKDGHVVEEAMGSYDGYFEDLRCTMGVYVPGLRLA